MLRFVVASLSLLVSLASSATTLDVDTGAGARAPGEAVAADGEGVAGDVGAVDTDGATDGVATDGATDAVVTDRKEAAAEMTAAQVAAEKLVGQKLVGPLAMNEEKRSRFSRARMPAQQRRVRVLDAEAKSDTAGDAFLAFAIDSRHGFMLDEDSDGWRADAIVGCVYPKSGKVFVKMGDSYRSGDAMLGKKVKPVKGAVCEAAPSTQVASKG